MNQTLLNLILTVSAAMLTGVASGFLSFLVDYTLWPGQIFAGYLPKLAKFLLKRLRPGLLSDLAQRSYVGAWTEEQREAAYIEAAGKSVAIFKVLGGCALCTGVWLSLITFVPIALFLPISPFAGIVHVVASHAVLRLLMKI